ncbi:MAG: prepilin-type N-terminal cleavage/methylation domain-containing protein [Calditerrivibrio sp.]|nr:prepilin-type N-terminal cleavage/methylation domain-containing protein [Calditerrivibrio sp.]
MDRKIVCRGLTLIELLITISILSILIAISIVSYNGYTKKREVENDTYRIFSLVNKARTSSFTDKTNYYIYLSNDGFEVVMDNNTNSGDGVMDSIFLKRRFLSDNSSYLFDKNGFLKPVGKIYPEDIEDVQYNCIKFADMVYMGKMNGGNCEPK